MPKSSNPSSSTVAAPAVSAGAGAAATPAPITQSVSEQNAAAAAFLADAPAPVTPAAETPTPEIAAETPATDDATPGHEASAEAQEPQNSETSDLAEPPTDAPPEWIEQVRQKIKETGVVPPWFFERAAATLMHELEKNAKIRALEAEVSELKSATDAKPTVVVDTPDNAFAKLTAADLQQNETWFNQRRAWALRNLTTGGIVGDKEYTPTDAADMLLEAEQAIDLIKSAKSLAEQRRTHFETVAKVAYPELAMAGTELRKQVDALKASKPAYARYADSDTDLADMLAGRKLREDRARGIQSVSITAKPKPAAAAMNGKTVSPAVGTVPKGAIRPSSAAPDLGTLRKQAQEGSERAQNALAALFLEPAAT